MKKIAIVLLALVLTSCAQTSTDHSNLEQSDYPKQALTNGIIDMSVYLPDQTRGYYRGSRFDWSGVIERVDYAGHHFYSPLHPTHDPKGHDSISGPAEEFGMYAPMGYEEASVGESFIKVGVGLLRKDSEEAYQFYKNYDVVQPGNWQIKQGKAWIDFQQELDHNGWGYHYTKRIELVDNQAEFKISHRLENTGQKVIDLDHYNHNFILIDSTPYGPDYDVSFPFSTEEPQSIFDLAWYKGNQIELDQPLNDKSLWSLVHKDPAPASYNGATIRNNKTGASLSFQGDADISHFIFWAVERAICPEPFIKIQLAPSEVQEWSTLYQLSVD